MFKTKMGEMKRVLAGYMRGRSSKAASLHIAHTSHSHTNSINKADHTQALPLPLRGEAVFVFNNKDINGWCPQYIHATHCLAFTEMRITRKQTRRTHASEVRWCETLSGVKPLCNNITTPNGV